MVLADLLRPLVARAEALAAFQTTLNAMWTPAEQKKAILEAYAAGLLSDGDTQLLIDVYDLAGA